MTVISFSSADQHLINCDVEFCTLNISFLKNSEVKTQNQVFQKSGGC